MSIFKLSSKYKPAGDQIKAIESLINGVESGKDSQVLLGVTGSGKTFTIANVIQKFSRPTIIMAHNKTLAAQLYAEMKEFFPENAVEYFVSYYDYYQPEAYLPKSDTYIEKDAVTNDDIERLRHSATRSLIERRDVILVASVSSIYGIGSPDTYGRMVIELEKNVEFKMDNLFQTLIKLQYERNEIDFSRGKFRVRGDIVEIFPSYCEKTAIRIEYFGNTIESIFEVDSLTMQKIQELSLVKIYPNSHYATPIEVVKNQIPTILEEMELRHKEFLNEGKFVEAERIMQRVKYDLEMMSEIGFCKGIENYSRYLTGRPAGSPPPTLFEYMPKDAILVMDESHVSVPQIRAMYAGDRARKTNLVDHGFRLISALDNRPMTFDEWYKIKPQTIYVSATPAEFELKEANHEVISQVIRPTGLLDPVCEIRSAETQVDDVIAECRKIIAKKLRVIITTLTKKMAEKLNEYLGEVGIKSTYIHSEVETLERISIIHGFRLGRFDVLVGVNLLREGIDIPECGLVAIMDADKEGFLRSETSLIQLIGRAARNSEGRVILYANKITKSMEKALSETERRRTIQIAHNEKHGIIPTTIIKTFENPFEELLSNQKDEMLEQNEIDVSSLTRKQIESLIERTKKDMKKAAQNLEFEKASSLRDLLREIQSAMLRV